ncbi:hypothetical protein SPRG_16143 [Saprolegnia parasitica CBS 223.65]|uniref:Uncharacterized protein n=1 Tax=Saprolegnia parasitica (strain CBS 223.65) TaxID=695850 RepID=A0A067BVT0_SAPPC|nr:hypothetical protein SPRG_16143 [Saprolegnia parasitica CBS 223.65]KDO18406.1 hypothetical protein SPRG_16143 [Saprolegnia parasitica CBS 223.65]|eukprot:XP_012210883.1 hypothetical protein SPRG_16143 [Saprolegnia parasitica CBS 223.65]
MDGNNQLDCTTSQTLPLQLSSRGSGKTLLAVGGDWIVQYDVGPKDFYLQSISLSQPIKEKADLNPVSQISTDGTYICAKSGTSVKCGPLRLQNGNRVWKTTTSNLLSTAMAANSATMYGLSSQNNLHRATVAGITNGTVSWLQVTGAPKFSKIAYDGKRVCGIKTPGNSIVCTISDLASQTPTTWSSPLPENSWSSLALSNNQIYAVTSASVVKRIAAPIQ